MQHVTVSSMHKAFNPEFSIFTSEVIIVCVESRKPKGFITKLTFKLYLL